MITKSETSAICKKWGGVNFCFNFFGQKLPWKYGSILKMIDSHVLNSVPFLLMWRRNEDKLDTSMHLSLWAGPVSVLMAISSSTTQPLKGIASKIWLALTFTADVCNLSLEWYVSPCWKLHKREIAEGESILSDCSLVLLQVVLCAYYWVSFVWGYEIHEVALWTVSLRYLKMFLNYSKFMKFRSAE